MKFKSVVTCALLGLVIVCSATAQTTTRIKSTQSQWEYLIVSFGKVYFANPLTDPEAKATGYSKLLSFSQAGIVTAQEGLSTQRSMDTLGKFGWELVATVGAIGGDQEMVFKRGYDETRSKHEEELIKLEGERIRQILEDERTKSAKVISPTELVDLDDAERIDARNANRKTQEDRLRSALAAVTSPAMKVRTVFSAAYSANDTDVTALVMVDGTSQLLSDGNKYRSNAAKQLADSALKAAIIAAAIKERSAYDGDTSLAFALGKVKISVEVTILFNGKEKNVATAMSGGDW